MTEIKIPILLSEIPLSRVKEAADMFGPDSGSAKAIADAKKSGMIDKAHFWVTSDNTLMVLFDDPKQHN